MPSRFTVVVGPARSGKTEALLARYREVLLRQRKTGRLEATLWIAPNRRAVEQVRERVLRGELSGCFSPGIQTFDQFAEQVLAYADAEVRPIDDRMKRLLLERILQRFAGEGKLRYFRGISHTPGFLDLAAQFVSELKRVEIWPEHFEQACRTADGLGPPGKLADRERELIALYGEYQLELTKHSLYDQEGRFWSARHNLQQGQRRPWERLDLVVVDGFSDFTRTQLEILDELAKRSADVVVSLPDEPGDDRDELFAKPRRTLAQLRVRRSDLIVEPCERRKQADWPALDHVERELFKSPRSMKPATDTARIEFIASQGAVAEIEELARRIKRLLIMGDDTVRPARRVQPHEIAVVFRSLGESAPLVSEFFTRYGIPVAVETGAPLGRSPSVTALVGLIRLAVEDWPFRDLLAVVGSNYFRPAWPEWQRPGAATALERTIRFAQLPSGRSELLALIEREAMRAPEEAKPGDPIGAERAARLNRRRADALLALPVLRKLAAALDELPGSATAAEWSSALTDLAGEVGLVRSMSEARAGKLRSQPHRDLGDDFAAWRLFHDSLQASDLLADLLRESPARVERPALVDMLDEIAGSEVLPAARDEAGRVRVLGAITARSLSIPYLFVAGLTEKSFPAAESTSRFYGEAELQQLAKRGLPVSSSTDRRRDEMLLFYETITRAERRLWLSFPALNEKAEPLLPSPYLAELGRICGEDLNRPARISDLTPIPPPEAMLNLFDARVRGVAAASQGEPEELAAVAYHSTDAGDNMLAGLDVVDRRSRGEAFGPYEGMIAGEAGRKRLAKRFGADFPWSAGQLEQYGACPFQFFLARVLRLAPPDEVGLEIDYGKRGSRVHEVLAEMHARINAKLTRHASPSELDAADYETLVNEVIGEFLTASADPSLEEAFRAIDEKLLRRWLSNYLGQHEKYEATHKSVEHAPLPRHFEASFGMAKRDEDEISTTEPLVLELHEERVRITGRIDRIDVGLAAGRAVFTIVDYKTGGAAGYTKAAVESGQALQLTLYAMAAEQLLLKNTDAVPWQFGYWFVADSGFKKTLLLHEVVDAGVRPTDAWQALREAIVRRVIGLVQGIRGGQFPMASADEDCTSRCDFNTVCRVGQVRSLEKRWQPPLPAQR